MLHIFVSLLQLQLQHHRHRLQDKEKVSACYFLYVQAICIIDAVYCIHTGKYARWIIGCEMPEQ